MCRLMRPASWSNRHRLGGLTLVELLVTLVILSILAAAALPYAEIAVRREKEWELRRALREVRQAIDYFHDDWKAGRLPRSAEGVSEEGYPKTLAVLVQGIDAGDAKGSRRRYLRRVPSDPFADAKEASTKHWLQRGFQDDPEAQTWNGRDVYDLRSQSAGQALDGSYYRDW